MGYSAHDAELREHHGHVHLCLHACHLSMDRPHQFIQTRTLTLCGRVHRQNDAAMVRRPCVLAIRSITLYELRGPRSSSTGGALELVPAWWYPTPTWRHRNRVGGVPLGRSARNLLRFEAELPLLKTVARSLIVNRPASHICAISDAVCSTLGRVPQKTRTDLCSCTQALMPRRRDTATTQPRQGAADAVSRHRASSSKTQNTLMLVDSIMYNASPKKDCANLPPCWLRSQV